MSGCKTVKHVSETEENQDTIAATDSLNEGRKLDSIKPIVEKQIITDTDNFINDTLVENNKIENKSQDSTVVEQTQSKQQTFIDDKIERSCNDSTIQDFKNNKIYYYGGAKVIYDNITIEAEFIEFDFENRTVFAKGLPDSTGKIYGTPVFTEGKCDSRSLSETMLLPL